MRCRCVAWARARGPLILQGVESGVRGVERRAPEVPSPVPRRPRRPRRPPGRREYSSRPCPGREACQELYCRRGIGGSARDWWFGARLRAARPSPVAEAGGEQGGGDGAGGRGAQDVRAEADDGGPALGPDDEQHLAVVGQRRRGDRLRGLLVQDEDGPAGGEDGPHAVQQPPPDGELLHLRDPGPAGLLGGGERDRLPALPPAGGLLARPHRHAPLALPRDDGVDPHLGGGLHGLLVPPALGQGLDEGEPDRRLRLVGDGPDADGELLPHGGGDLTADPGALAVDDVDGLAGPHAAHGHGVPALGATDGERGSRTRGRDVGRRAEEDRSAHQRPENLSRRRENTPEAAGVRRGSARSSPRRAASSASSSRWRSSSSVGTSTSTWTLRSPRPPPLRRPTPRPDRVMTSSGWVPGRMSISWSPSKVSRCRTVPRAAAVIGTSTRA